MPVPIIVGAAAAVAARFAAKKAAQELAKKAAKAAATKTAQVANNSVKTKAAAKQVGNPPNNTKAWEDYIGSVSRGAPGRGPAGKAKATRVANSKIAKKTVPSAKEPARIPEVPARATVKINSAKITRLVRVSPKKVTLSSKNGESAFSRINSSIVRTKPARKSAKKK
jgi:cell pole-organizing protein PopZ